MVTLNKKETIATNDDAEQLKTDLVIEAINKLNIALKSLRLYPPEHAFSREKIGGLLQALQTYFTAYGHFDVGVEKDYLTLDGKPIAQDSAPIAALALRLFRLQLEWVSIGPNVDESQLASLLAVLSMDPEEATQAESAAGLLKQMPSKDISLAEITAKRVYETDDSDADREALDLTELYALLHKGEEASDIEKQRLRRELFEGSGHLADFLIFAGRGASDVEKGAALAERIFPKLDGLTRHQSPSSRERMFRTLVKAVLVLNEALRAQVTKALLSSAQPRVATAARHIFRQLSLDELENLSADLSREETAGGALADKLAEMAAKRSVERTIDPWKGKPDAPRRVAEQIAGGPDERLEDEDASAALLTASDFRAAGASVLCELLYLEDEPQRLEPVLNGLRRVIDDAVGQAHITSATNVLQSIKDELKSHRLKPEKSVPIKGLIGDAGRPDRLSTLIDRLDDAQPIDFAELDQYVCLLGNFGIVSLLDILAMETGAGRRRVLCRLLASCGKNNLACLGSKVLDHRWYLVRNVVSILGQMGDARVIPYLERAVAHADSRVRLETVRALSSLGPSAFEALRVLVDDVEKNIRLESIAALGNIKNPAAAPLLTKIAERRDILNRNADFRLAATRALENLQGTSGLVGELK